MGLLRLEVDRAVLDLLLAVRGARLDADPTPGAVVGRDLDRHLHPGQVAVAPVLGLELLRRALERGRVVDLHPDRGVRADEGALRAVDADRGIPDRDLCRDRALLDPAGARRERPVGGERAHRQRVALAGEHHRGHVADEVRLALEREMPVRARRHHDLLVGHRDLVHAVERPVDRLDVALDDGLAALAVRLAGRLLDRVHGLVEREHAREGEEARLQHGVDATAETGVAGDPGGVDDEQPQALLPDLPAHVRRQVLPDLVGRGRVEEERGSLGGDAEDVDRVEQAELVAGDEPRPLDEVGRADRSWPEAQVRDGRRARLLRVVDEVALGVQAGALADDGDRACGWRSPSRRRRGRRRRRARRRRARSRTRDRRRARGA